MSRTCHLLVFDWDGTLMDSVGAIVACMHHAVADLALPPIPEDVIRRTIGLGLEDTMAALGVEDTEDLGKRLVERYRYHWFDTYRERPLPFQGVEETLRSLREKGYLLAVATGKSRRGLDRDLAGTGFGPLFHASRTADETFSKPHPRMLLELLEELGERREETVMVGDTTFDLQMAANAGTGAIAVTSGSHSREDLLELSPLACLDDVTQLLRWLQDGSATR